MDINLFCTRYNLGKVLTINQLHGGLMHKIYKVETNKGTYAVKILNPEVMNRSDAYNNFVISESIANLAKINGIPVSSALKIEDNFILNYNNQYYMVFDFVDGKTINDDEITVDHCQIIGSILANIHSLDYSRLGLDTTIKEDKFFVEWENYIKCDSFNDMVYKDIYLSKYKRYYVLLHEVVASFNANNKFLAVCHKDMDPKNVMWNNNKPVVIDWESASLSNPYYELIEIALSWSGFLSDKFSENKFRAVISEYNKLIDISDLDLSNIIYGNLIGRFGWLDYNLKRSLGLKSADKEEKALAEAEVFKTMNEIDRYLNLMDRMSHIVASYKM